MKRAFLHSLLIALWFVLLAFPIAGLRVDDGEIIIRWKSVIVIGVGVFFIALIWRRLLSRRKDSPPPSPLLAGKAIAKWKGRIAEFAGGMFADSKKRRAMIAAAAIFFMVFPLIFSPYQVSILTTALLYVVLGLGLNIVVGLAGLLDLGYVAFYAVGAYTYALSFHYWGLGFWSALPAAGALAALFGIVLGVPVLRLRGDYLAIVTLGFGEIIRLVLENWSAFTLGPQGVANIPKPFLFGVEDDFNAAHLIMYFLTATLAAVTIIVVRRLDNSRIGRAWHALREDQLACQASGIDAAATKLRAFALGACWAGFVGVLFAAKTSYINPASFTFLQSAIILCIVVLGGMGSVAGVVFAALLLTLIPEYLRVLSDYRMLAFGALMVAMMIFRPDGLFRRTPPKYEIEDDQ